MFKEIDSQMYQNFRRNLRNKRKELGLTLKQVAEKLGVSESLISRYESNDVKNMGIDKIIPLAKVLDTTPEFLMGWEDKKEEKENNIFSQLTDDELAKLEKFKNMSTVMFMNEGNDISDEDKETLATAYAEVLISQRKK